MGTTADKLNKLLQTKESIRVAINNKGGMVSKNDTFSSYATAIENIQTSADSICVDYLDIDGTLLKREYLDKGDTTTPPSNPNPDSEYLIFDGWSDTEFTNITESKTFYATYTTKDNATYIFIHIPTANKSITLKFSGTITSVDWGDEVIDTSLSHTYSNIGDYVIKVIGGTSIISHILGSENNNYYVLKSYISGTITSISPSGFDYCYSLTSISLPKGLTKLGGTFAYCSSLRNIDLPKTLTSIGYDTFKNCTSLTNIILPNNINGLGDHAFSGCYSLTSVNLPNNLQYLLQEVFKDCYSLKNIKLPNSITEMRSYLFQNCYSLTSVNLPSSITNISDCTFHSCYSLATINLPDSITSLGSYAFANCFSLDNIILPSNVINIGNHAFNNCYRLTNINLPVGITSLGEYVFNECRSLRQVIINASSVITIQSNSFRNTYNTKFYVPDNLVEDYKVATNWVNFADRIYPISSLPKE